MLFEQRMNEIENDVLPFGFIDDGVPDLPQVDPMRAGWGISEVWDPDL